jgi:hypothetical protein
VTLEVWNGINGTNGGGGGSSTTVLGHRGGGNDVLATGWVGSTITFTSGANNGLSRVIETNTSANFTWPSNPLPSPVGVGDAYTVKPLQKGSAKWSVTVGGSPAFVFGHSRTTNINSSVANAGDTMESACFTYGSDAISTVVVTLLSGPITSATIYSVQAVTAVITGTTLTVTMPVRSKAIICVNGNRKDRLNISANNLKTSIPGGAVTFAAQAQVNAAQTIYFPAGVYALPSLLWLMSSTAGIYLDYGAYVVGNLDWRGQNNLLAQGPGILSGEFATNEFVEALPNFSAQVQYTMVLGYDDRGGSSYLSSQNFLRDLTIFIAPWYGTFLGVTHVYDVTVLSPWRGNCDGIHTAPDISLGTTVDNTIIDHCLVDVADDAIHDPDSFRRRVVTDTLIATINGSELNAGFWSADDITGTHYCKIVNSKMVPFGKYSAGNGDAALNDSMLKFWSNDDVTGVDAPDGHFDVTIDGLYIYGPVNKPVWDIENHDYPYGTVGHKLGQVARNAFRNITIESTPTVLSRVIGLDQFNTPHDNDWHNVRIGGVLLTARNWADFFVTNSFVYNIRVGGRNVVSDTDICNLALSRLGHQAKITSISPPDDTTEAKLCAKFLPLARNTISELHLWSFATKRAVLVLTATSSEASSYQFAYELPDDFLDIIAVIPSTAADDYAQPSTWVDLNGSLPTAFSAAQATQYVPVDYAIEQDSTGALVLYTNLESAVLRYTAYVTDVNFFGPTLIEALTWYLAGQLAGALIKGTEGAKMAQLCGQTAMQFLAQAKDGDSAARQVRPRQSVSWIDGR